MLKRMTIKNLTVFPEVDIKFGENLNVIVGENGSGKTHLLKVAYCILAASAEEGKNPRAGLPTKTLLQTKLADKLVNVFRPDTLGRLVRRKQGLARCDIHLSFTQEELDVGCSFATSAKSEVKVDALPSAWEKVSPAYLPTRELLTIYPNFVSVYEGHYLELEETWRDTCRLLGEPLKKGPKESRIRELLYPLEEAMGGSIELDQNGRFYLRNASGSIEMPLVAEGLRKLGMLARLISTGTLLDQGYLFWDEPEANLNPRIVKSVAKSIVDLSAAGIQVFIATHSLFLLRELDMLLSQSNSQGIDARFFGLHSSDNGVTIDQGDSIDDIGDITSLDEELEQSDRFLSGHSA